MGKRFVFREYSSSTLSRKIKKFHNKLGNTNTRSKQLVNCGSLQNTISKVSSTTEKANGELLFTKPAATDLGRNSGNAEKGCSSQNNTKQKQQPRVLNQFVFSR